MVKETRYRKAYKAKKSFPRLVTETKKSYKELSKFGFGMTTDEYSRIMNKLIGWAQAEFPGEIATEVKTRVQAQVSKSFMMTPAMIQEELGERPAEMTVTEYNNTVKEAQKNYIKIRTDYLKDVKGFIAFFS